MIQFRRLVQNKNLLRFFSTQSIQQKQSTLLTDAEKKFSDTPIHLRSYNPQKYEVPAKKIRMNSGYALLEIEPMPRARIMRICYNILQQVKIGIPQDSLFRIFTQERTKWIMNVVDKNEDIQKLEQIFAVEIIQLFIQSLVKQLDNIQMIRHLKPWENKKEQAQQYSDFFNEMFPQDVKNPKYQRSERTKKQFMNI